MFRGENRFDGAAISAAADERAIGAFAEDEIERVDDDRFAGAGFAGDGVIAGGEVQGEVRDQSEVLDAERGQHGRIKAKATVGARKKNGMPLGGKAVMIYAEAAENAEAAEGGKRDEGFLLVATFSGSRFSLREV